MFKHDATSEYGPTDPSRIFALGWSNNTNFRSRRDQQLQKIKQVARSSLHTTQRERERVVYVCLTER